MIQVFQGFITGVRDITGDFFRAQLGITGLHFKLGDVDGGEGVFLHGFFGDDNSVFKVVAVPRHIGHQNIAAEGQFALVRVRAVRQHVAGFDFVAAAHDRTLVDAGSGIGTHELAQGIDVNAIVAVRAHTVGIGQEYFRTHGQFPVFRGDNDFSRGGGHDAVRFRQNDGTGVPGALSFDAGSHVWRFRYHQRHALALHVGAHQGAVGVVMFQEGDKTGGDGNELLGRNVHVMHVCRIHFDEFAFFTGGYAGGREVALFVQRVIGLGDEIAFFLIGGDVFDGIGDPAIFHLAVRRFNESEFIDAGVGTHGVDQADVGTFRRFNGANAPVVGGVYVPDFESGPVTVQAAGPQGGKTALVRQFREGVDLVHELGELGAAEEVAHDGAEGLRIDEFAGRDAFNVLVNEGHAFLDQALGAGKAYAALIGHEFAYGTYAAAAQVVDVVHHAFALLEAQEVFEGGQEIFRRHQALVQAGVQPEFLVDFVAPHAGEVVFLGIVKKPLKQGACLSGSSGISGTQAFVDFLEGGFFVVSGILLQGFDQHVVLALVNDVDFLDAELEELANHTHIELFESLGKNQVLVLDRVHSHKVVQIFFRHVFAQGKRADVVELADDVAVRFEAQVAHKRRRKEFAAAAAAVKVNVKQVVGVKLDLQPGAPVRDDAEGVEQFSVQMLGAFKANARGTVQLGHNDAFGAVDDKGAAVGHHGEFSHIDRFFLGLVVGFELEGDLKGGAVGFPRADGLVIAHLRLFNVIGDEVELNVFVIALDRKDFLQNAL